MRQANLGRAAALIDLGGDFPVASTTNVLTLFLYAAPNAALVWTRVVEEVSGAVAEVELTVNVRAATQLLSPRNYMNKRIPGGRGRLRLLWTLRGDRSLGSRRARAT
jgi:hypothetical protein